MALLLEVFFIFFLILQIQLCHKILLLSMLCRFLILSPVARPSPPVTPLIFASSWETSLCPLSKTSDPALATVFWVFLTVWSVWIVKSSYPSSKKLFPLQRAPLMLSLVLLQELLFSELPAGSWQITFDTRGPWLPDGPARPCGFFLCTVSLMHFLLGDSLSQSPLRMSSLAWLAALNPGFCLSNHAG